MTKEPGKRARCPICGRPPEPAFRPFCSKRCADVDLARWLGGAYRVESDERPDGPPEEERHAASGGFSA